MNVQDIHDIFESWAPAAIAWERDNVGLQVGSMTSRVRKILVTLDMTDEVLREAAAKKADLIVSHHPLLFHPARSVTPDDRVGRLVYGLVRSRIALYSAHTNLDFTRGGVSFALAARLGLRETEVLAKDQPVMLKLVVFVPPTHADSLMAAMASAGAGTIGNYELCSFRLEGTGTFKPAPGAKPFTGAAGRLESVEEVRLEMVLPRWKLEGVVAAMRRAHPYEEAAYDVYDLANSSDAYGSGAIGALETRMPLSKFLARVKRALGVPSLRFTGRPRGGIKRVAVCGGSGSGYLQAAIRRGADAFVTSDCTYHLFQECDGRIALIDAGHFETERPVVPVIVEYLRQQCGRPPAGVRVAASTSMKNIVQYYMS